LADWQGRGGVLKFVQATLNGFAMAVEKLSDVAYATVTEFESLRGRVESSLSFIEGRKGPLHGLFDRHRIWRKHEGIQPRGGEILFQPP